MKPLAPLAAFSLTVSALGLAATPAIPAERPCPRPASLSLAYDGILVVKVLNMTIDQQITPDHFAADAALKTSGVLALFKRIDVHAKSHGAVEGGEYKPAAFEHVNLDGHDNRHVQVRWTGGDVTTNASPAFPDYGAPPANRTQKLAAADPLTQLARIAATPVGDDPCRNTARFFDGRQLYDVAFGAPASRSPGARESAMGLTSPVACALTFNEVAGFDAKSADKKNQGLNRPMTIEFARLPDNGVWVITAVRGKTPLGEARIELVRLRATS